MQGEGFDPFMLPFSLYGRRGWGKRVARRQPKSGMLPSTNEYPFPDTVLINNE
jgi:hypothetical protein